MKYIVTISILLMLVMLKAELPAYRIFNAASEEIKYEEMVKELLEADVVLFGELHDNPISHWLEFKLTESVYMTKGSSLVLGAEMFEADNQLIMDEYLQGKIKTNHFEENIRLWPNYQTDYKPLVEFARENDLNFVATNIPRRYASIVARIGFEGLDDLSDEAKGYMAPLPMPYDENLECYRKMSAMSGMPGKMHAGNLPKAQASKDAAMAYFISKNIKDGDLFLHYNGRYHSDYRQSMVWYLNQYAPKLNVKTISTSISEELEVPEEDLGSADFIICVPESMTRTYK